MVCSLHQHPTPELSHAPQWNCPHIPSQPPAPTLPLCLDLTPLGAARGSRRTWLPGLLHWAPCPRVHACCLCGGISLLQPGSHPWCGWSALCLPIIRSWTLGCIHLGARPSRLSEPPLDCRRGLGCPEPKPLCVSRCPPGSWARELSPGRGPEPLSRTPSACFRDGVGGACSLRPERGRPGSRGLVFSCSWQVWSLDSRVSPAT